MKVHYDREEDILMLEMVGEGTVEHAEQTGPFVAHFSQDGQLLLLEILDASEFLSSLIKVTLRGQEELPLAIGQGSQQAIAPSHSLLSYSVSKSIPTGNYKGHVPGTRHVGRSRQPLLKRR